MDLKRQKVPRSFPVLMRRAVTLLMAVVLFAAPFVGGAGHHHSRHHHGTAVYSAHHHPNIATRKAGRQAQATLLNSPHLASSNVASRACHDVSDINGETTSHDSPGAGHADCVCCSVAHCCSFLIPDQTTVGFRLVRTTNSFLRSTTSWTDPSWRLERPPRRTV